VPVWRIGDFTIYGTHGKGAKLHYHRPMPSKPSHSEDATLLMNAAAEGDKAAADQLLPMVYDQLRKAAQLGIAGERPGHSFSATMLVHEAYLKLVGPRQVPWAGRGHFYAAAVQAMRRILIDHARTRASQGGGARQLTEMLDVAALAESNSDQILAVDAALTRLEAEDPESAAVVRLRFYAGLSVEQSAEVLGISERTAARLWNYARAVLYRMLSDLS
jgi:RNA polymerase sigma factor (TIGR02999 family)